jgi:hypothetical protein
MRKAETDTYGKPKRKKTFTDRDFIFGLGIEKLKREKTSIRTEILYLIRIGSEESNLFAFGLRLGLEFLYRLPKSSTYRRDIFVLTI